MFGFSSNAPCMLVWIARIFAVPREPTTRTVDREFRLRLDSYGCYQLLTISTIDSKCVLR